MTKLALDPFIARWIDMRVKRHANMDWNKSLETCYIWTDMRSKRHVVYGSAREPRDVL